MTYEDLTTPDLSEAWCPKCSPLRDPSREILRTSWCKEHDPLGKRTDLDEPAMYLLLDDSGNPALCNLIHRPDRA